MFCNYTWYLITLWWEIRIRFSVERSVFLPMKILWHFCSYHFIEWSRNMLKPVATNGDLFNISNSKFPYEKIKARYFEFYPFMFISFKIPQCSPTRKDMKKGQWEICFSKEEGGRSRYCNIGQVSSYFSNFILEMRYGEPAGFGIFGRYLNTFSEPFPVSDWTFPIQFSSHAWQR